MPDEIEALFEELARSRLGRQEYTNIDRYRDFRSLFLSTDQGRRVLYEIMAWGHIYRSTAVRGDPHETYRREGERNMALRVLTTIHVEPKAPPTEQKTKE